MHFSPYNFHNRYMQWLNHQNFHNIKGLFRKLLRGFSSPPRFRSNSPFPRRRAAVPSPESLIIFEVRVLITVFAYRRGIRVTSGTVPFDLGFVGQHEVSSLFPIRL